jgi:hypothetical protein
MRRFLRQLSAVTVTATQTDTTFARAVVTDASGNYVMTNLPTGPYRLELALQGFRTYVQTGIVLQVGAAPTINATLGDCSILATRASRQGHRGSTRNGGTSRRSPASHGTCRRRPYGHSVLLCARA